MDQKHILVVDDEESDRMLLTEMLNSGGHKVLTAADSSEAMRLVRENRFDLALVDLSMPGLDGFGLIGLLTRDKTFEARVLVVSGRVLEKDVDRAIKTGASGYIAKPYDRVTLLARVEELLG